MAHILIVDDEDHLRQLLRLILTRGGHTSAEACEGDEAIAACGVQRFDLVLCDILMPGREGLETIRELRQRHPALRVIAMSGGMAGMAMDPLRIATFLGACGTLSKPFRVEQVLSLVSEVLGGPAPADQTPLPAPRRVEETLR